MPQQVQICLWRELPEGVEPSPGPPSNCGGYHPNHIYHWRWLVVDAHSDKRHTKGGIERSQVQAVAAARAFASAYGLRIIHRNSPNVKK